MPRTSTEDPVEEEDSASSVSESDEDEADMNAATSTLNELQKAAGSLSGVADALSKAKQSRGEKKARKVRGVPIRARPVATTMAMFRVHIG
jgi:hypothetical protein